MIAIHGLELVQGRFRLHDVSLAVQDGAYAVLMGDTGCGKTSLVEAICGLRPIIAGSIRVGSAVVTHLPPGARGLGYVPQDGALFPTMDVAAHLAFAPRVQGWDAGRIRHRVAELAARLELVPLLNRRVQGLSGGERQRVALGRALAAQPQALLLDEPLAAVDEGARYRLCLLLKDVCREQHLTVLHVTHSRSEADLLADVHLRLTNGAVRQENREQPVTQTPDGNNPRAMGSEDGRYGNMDPGSHITVRETFPGRTEGAL